jgi:hypothetical protein
MYRPRRHRAALAALIALVLATSGCGKKEDTMQPTVTAEQASARVDAVVQEAHRQLPPGAELKPHGAEGKVPCDDPTDGGPAGRIFVEKQYQLQFPPDWPADQALPRLAEYWQQKSYRVHNDSRAKADPRLVVETPDGYRASIEVFDRGAGRNDVYLVGSSPCVWEFGTPNPQ